MANSYTDTGEHYLPVPAITDKFSYSRDIQDLRKLLSKGMESLAAFDSNADNYLLASGNAGTIISSADTAPRGRVASITASGDATLLFQDNDGASLTDKWVLGYDDGGDGFIINDAATPNATFLLNRLHMTATAAGVTSGSSGATASTGADDWVVEHSTNGGISILAPDASNANVYFGSPTDNVNALCQWDGGAQVFYVGSAIVGGETVLRGGNSQEVLRLHSDADAQFAGKVGIGVEPSYTCHVQSASSGATASTNADDGVFENSGNAGISILGGATSNKAVYFGEAADNLAAFLQYEQTGPRLRVGTHIASGTIEFETGIGVDALILHADQRVSIGTTNSSAQLRVHQAGSADNVPVLLLEQDDISEPFTTYRGTATAANLTRSIVAEGDVTTATRQGFLMCNVVDDGNQITDQDYFIAIYTLA